MDFSPLDNVETRLLDYLRQKFVRVSVERIVSGPGLNNIYQGLAVQNHEKIQLMTDADLWAAALDGHVPLARTALDRLCLSYGAVDGALAPAPGPHAAVLAGRTNQPIHAPFPNPCVHNRLPAHARLLPPFGHTPHPH